MIVFGIWRMINCCYEKFRIRCVNFRPQTFELVTTEGYLLYCLIVSTQNCNTATCAIFPILAKYGKTLWTNKIYPLARFPRYIQQISTFLLFKSAYKATLASGLATDLAFNTMGFVLQHSDQIFQHIWFSKHYTRNSYYI